MLLWAAWALGLQQIPLPLHKGGFKWGCTMAGGRFTQPHRTTRVPAEQTAAPRDHHQQPEMGQLPRAAELTHAENHLAPQQRMGNGVKGKLGRNPNPVVPVCSSPRHWPELGSTGDQEAPGPKPVPGSPRAANPRTSLTTGTPCSAPQPAPAAAPDRDAWKNHRVGEEAPRFGFVAVP